MPGSPACRSCAPDLVSKTVPLTIFGLAPPSANGAACSSAGTLRAGKAAARVAAAAINSRREKTVFIVIFNLNMARQAV